MKDERDKIRNPSCELCPLHEEAEHVCLMGSGKTSSDIMIVGEAPGAREDETHQAFVGAAGKLLDHMLKNYSGISRKDCYITNVAKCRPPSNRTPERDEVKVCMENYFLPELDMVDPKYMLLLGNTALRGVVGKSGITKYRGTMYTVDDTTIFATVHPAHVLRNPRFTPDLQADFSRFGRIVRGEDARPETEIKIIRKASHLKWLLRQLRKADSFAYDIESAPLQEYQPGHHLASIAFTWEAGSAAFVPLWHEQTPWKDPGKVLKLLAPLLARKGVKHIAQNGKFDARHLFYYNAPIPQTFDTMLAAHMVDENRSKGLKPLAQTILGADDYDLGQEVREPHKVPLRKLARYNGKDTDYTFRLHPLLREKLKEEPRTARIFHYLMMPASNALVPIERRGVQVDHERWRTRLAEVVTKKDKLERFMLRHVPKLKREEFNFNSAPQVAEWLFNDMGLPILEETKKGAPSSKESVLLQLQKESEPVKALLKWRGWNKYFTTYIGPWQDHWDSDRRIHPSYKLHGTVTGRLSCTEPNLQNVPRNPFIRSILSASEGHVFVQADYSQVELRIAAMLAHEKRMLRLFDAGEDIHMNMAEKITGKKAKDISKEERKLAKAVNFGFLYSMGAEKFQSYAFDSYDLELSMAECDEYRTDFFEAYPALRPWHNRQKRLVNRYQYVNSPLGRRRHLPDITSQSKEVRAEAERQAINSPVQSTASDFTLTALILLHKRGIPIVGTVHDSLLFDIPEDDLDASLPVIKEVMEDTVFRMLKKWFGADITVPIVADIEYGTHWSDPSMEVWNG